VTAYLLEQAAEEARKELSSPTAGTALGA